MDANWFKRRQKAVGITADQIADLRGRARSNVSHILTGKQRMSLEWAEAFAQALKVDVATVLEKAGVAPHVAAQANPGFADGDAAPWIAPPGANGQVRSVASVLGGERPGVDVWRVRTDAMALAGILPGDMMLLDTHAADRCKPGDTVVAQVYDNTRGTATTVLRRLEPPVLVAASPARHRVHVVDGVNTAIRGRVVAVWRLPEPPI